MFFKKLKGFVGGQHMGQSAKQSTDDFKDVQCTVYSVQCTVYSVQCTKIGRFKPKTFQKKFCANTFFEAYY